MKDLYRQTTDAFFYNNYQLVWEGAEPEEMSAVYVAEMDALLRCLDEGQSYWQEFARDHPLAQKLRVFVDGKYQAPQRQRSPYAILPAQGVVLFQRDKVTVYQCSYRKFFQILKFYIQSLQEQFPEKAGQKEWARHLDALREGRWKTHLASLTEKLRFWETSPGDPNSHFEGSKKLNLGPKDIASFRQLRCQDTLRSLVAEGLSKAKDLEVLGEYTQLTCLHLRDMGVQDISFVSSLKNLTELGLRANQIRDLSPLAGLEKLDHLYIAGNPVQDLSVIEQLPALKTLFVDLEQLPDQLAWDAIPTRISLRVVQLTPLEKFQYNAEMVYSRSAPRSAKTAAQSRQTAPRTLGTQAQPADARRLNVKDRWLYSGLMNALGYPPAVKFDMTKLKQLDCSNGIRLCDDFTFLTEPGDYSCLEAAVNLRTLNLSGRVVKDYSWLRKCVNLRKLDLSQTDFSDLGLLADMKQLASLVLAGCPNLNADSLQPLKHLTKLKRLDLSNTKVRHLEWLKELNRLDSLGLEGCEGLKGMEQTLEDLAEIPSLRLSAGERRRYCQAALDLFCQRIETNGFRLQEGGSGALPGPLASQYGPIPQDWQDFLQRVASCVSLDGNTWFLTQQDYRLHPEIDYPWERTEQKGLWESEADEEYLPILVSLLEGRPEYYALSVSGAAVVHIKGEPFQKAAAAHSPQQFLIKLAKPHDGTKSTDSAY